MYVVCMCVCMYVLYVHIYDPYNHTIRVHVKITHLVVDTS